MNREERARAYADKCQGTSSTEGFVYSEAAVFSAYLAGAKDAEENPAWRMCEDELPEEWESVLLVWRNAFNPKWQTIVSRRIPTPNHRKGEPEWVWEHLNPKVIALCWLPLPAFNPKQETK